MADRSSLLTIFLTLWVVTVLGSGCSAQSATASTETQAWPEADVHIQFPSHLRVLAFGGVEQGVGYPYQQWYGAAGLGYQFKPILRPHLENIDPDKEHYLLFGGGYEYLRTIQPGKVKKEDRITIDLTLSFRLPVEILVRDRNWTELRWINGSYSTTYRNMLMLERDFLVHGFRFNPYGSAEVFYAGSAHSWNEEWYTAGIQWPYKRLMMLDTYYRRENCPTCNPPIWNVGGVTLNFYFGNTK